MELHVERACSAAERGGVREYLSGCHTASLLVSLIDRGGDVLFGVPVSAESLGRYLTFWLCVEGHHSASGHTVQEASAALNQGTKGRESVDRYKALAAQDKLEVLITVVQFPTWAAIFDGNKRAVAMYESGRSIQPRILRPPAQLVTQLEVDISRCLPSHIDAWRGRSQR